MQSKCSPMPFYKGVSVSGDQKHHKSSLIFGKKQRIVGIIGIIGIIVTL
jgi:hypothetical protein